MNITVLMIIIGAIIMAFGFLFIAQSQSLLGPQSSFMYQNPSWTFNGAIIVSLGVSLVLSSVIIGIKRRKL